MENEVLQRDPGSDDERYDAGGHGADAVDDEPVAPARLAPIPPPPDHTRLRQREGNEDAHGVERNERMGLAAEEHEQQGRHRAQHHDAVREDEALAEGGELARNEPIAREQ